MSYEQEEFDQILLSKKLNDFYFAIIENRGYTLTDEEYEKTVNRDIVYIDTTEEEIKSIIEKFQKHEKLKNATKELKKIIYSFAQIRHMAVITVINDKVYDVINNEFVDLKRNKIVHYDNITNYYNEDNARIKYFTPEEEPQLKEKTVGLYVEDESIVQKYETDHINQKLKKDITYDFFKDYNGKAYALKKMITR